MKTLNVPHQWKRWPAAEAESAVFNFRGKYLTRIPIRAIYKRMLQVGKLTDEIFYKLKYLVVVNLLIFITI